MKTVFIKPTEQTLISVEEDTQFVLDLLELNIPEVTLNLEFKKQGVSAEILGMYILDSSQSLSLTTIAHHIAPNTSCMTKVKGVLKGSSESKYIGKIIIDKSAQQTSSFLEDNVLIIGDATKNTSEPILEIDADDVRASHGSTTGRIDKNQIYYLMSRGVTKQDSEEIITQGFLESLLSQVNSDKIRTSLRKNLCL